MNIDEKKNSNKKLISDKEIEILMDKQTTILIKKNVERIATFTTNFQTIANK